MHLQLLIMPKNAQKQKMKLMYFETGRHETSFQLKVHCTGLKGKKNTKVINILKLYSSLYGTVYGPRRFILLHCTAMLESRSTTVFRIVTYGRRYYIRIADAQIRAKVINIPTLVINNILSLRSGDYQLCLSIYQPAPSPAKYYHELRNNGAVAVRQLVRLLLLQSLLY